MRDEVSKYKSFGRRSFIAGGIKVALLTLISGRYFYLQIKHSKKYKTLSENNRIKIIIVPPLRGIIKDRNDVIIAENTIHFRLGIDNSEIKNLESIIPTVETIISRPLKLSLDQINKRNKKRNKNEPLIIEDVLSWEEVSKLSLKNNLIPGVEVVEAPVRSYIGDDTFACITGYIGSPNEDEIEALDLIPFNELKIGKSGIEKVFDKDLRGYPGLRRSEVDVRGTYIREISKDDPKSGKDIKLTIDSFLQDLVCRTLESHKANGAVVVMDPQNGDILAMHSDPTFNPNEFVDGVSQKYWDSIHNTPLNPLINNVISTPYPPGSTFKLVTALAGLRAGVLPTRTHTCSGIHYVGSKPFKCWKSWGHGTLNMYQALAQSCNPYFYSLAQIIGPEIIAETARLLGLGSKTGVELSYEHSGLIPDPQWKQKQFKQGWYAGDTINTCIGQGYVLATPIQLATMTGRIASGKLIKPTLIYSEESKEIAQLDVPTKLLADVREGMRKAANEKLGTVYNHGMSHNNFVVCGKTGTAQVAALKHQNGSKKYNHHGLFTSFAPLNNPKYVISVIVEHGKGGSLSAAPIAKAIYDSLSGKNLLIMENS